MTTINLITPPDKIYSDAVSLLLVFPNTDLQKEIQTNILPSIPGALNVYLYDKPNYTKEDIDWLLSVVALSDLVIVDVDNCQPYVRDLLSYIIAKPKTYWLTNAVETVYTHISSSRIYNLSILENLGGSIFEEGDNNE